MWEAILVDCAQGDATVHRLPPRSRIRPSDPPDFQRRRVRQINLYPTAAAAYAALVPRFMILLAWFLYSRRWIQHGLGLGFHRYIEAAAAFYAAPALNGVLPAATACCASRWSATSDSAVRQPRLER